MNLSRYPNLRKAEKIKSTQDITERCLFSLPDSSVMTQIVERMCIFSKVILFLIAADWCSPIVVTRSNVFLHLILKSSILISSTNFIVYA